MIHRVVINLILAVVFGLVPLWVQQQALAAEQGSAPATGNDDAPSPSAVTTPQTTRRRLGKIPRNLLGER